MYTCRCQHLNYDPSFLHTISLRALYPLIHLYFPVIIQIFLSSVCVYKRETNNFWPSGGLSISTFMNEKILFNFVILICCLCQTFTWWMAFFKVIFLFFLFHQFNGRLFIGGLTHILPCCWGMKQKKKGWKSFIFTRTHVAQLRSIGRLVRVGLRARTWSAIVCRYDRLTIAGLHRRTSTRVPGHHCPAAK